MERVEKFKKDFILKHIISHEKKTRTYSKWLQILESLPFSYTTLPYDEWKAQKEKEALLQNRIGKRHFAAAERAKQVLLQANKDNQDVLKE
jgi:dGTP triphosphohydrolase